VRDRLEALERRHDELAGRLGNPEVIADQDSFRKSAQEFAEIDEVVKAFRRSKEIEQSLAGNRDLLAGETDPEMVAMAKEEIARQEQELATLDEKIKVLLIPKDPRDAKGVILEIRAGTGGDEAGLFAGELLRMYSLYAVSRKWKVEPIDISTTPLGGVKEAIVEVAGEGVYSRLKFEAGVHRVQRIPATESGGRIHTSTVTVAVLPEVDEVEVKISPEDLRIDFFRSSGAGGQHVNKTESAVRITHLPTGIVVTCQDEKSQHKNKASAMSVLRARVYDRAQAEQAESISEDRRKMVGSGERSEKIRTYNFPQNRVTDHRIGLSSHRLPEVLKGEIDEFIDQLTHEEQARALSNR
jgi:peptide chain release factor 1